jgi:Fur family peroxide stress response transcriptional regulator
MKKRRALETNLAEFYHTCKKNNLKLTPQRVQIFKELIESNEHPTANKIYRRVKKKIPNISFDTVNRTLLKFVEIGLAKIVEGKEDFRRYDGVVARHHHFYCIKCHRIIDIYDQRLDDINIPKVLDERLVVIDSKIIFDGICDKCKKNSF